MQKWNHQSAVLGYDVDCVVQLGDLIDGRCAKNKDTYECLGRVLTLLGNAVAPHGVYHIIGNHELYNFSREELKSQKGAWYGGDRRQEGIFYYSKRVKNVRMIFLDAFEISVMNGEGDDRTEEAKSILRSNNPNVALPGRVDWTAGLGRDKIRFLPYNGKFGVKQLAWLKAELQAVDAANEKALIFSHTAFCPGACSASCMTWDYDEALNIVQSSKCVLACFYGHAHKGGYTQDEFEIHHVTLASPLESKEATFAVADFYEDRIVLRGNGRIPSRTLMYGIRGKM